MYKENRVCRLIYEFNNSWFYLFSACDVSAYTIFIFDQIRTNGRCVRDYLQFKFERPFIDNLNLLIDLTSFDSTNEKKKIKILNANSHSIKL